MKKMILVIAQANEPLDENNWFKAQRVTARVHEETMLVDADSVDYMDVSTKTDCIHCDSNDSILRKRRC